MKNHKVVISGWICLLAAEPLLAEEISHEAVMPVLSPVISSTLPIPEKPIYLESEETGKIYITGVASALAYTQTNALAVDETSQGDFSNGQLIVQKADGWFQFYAQFGEYSLPAIGSPYIRGDNATDLYSWIPQAYIKIVPNEYFSVQAGKIPTLIGAEYTFTFQNANIQRGLLWNQENAVVRGVQLNFSYDDISASVSLNDGFYSEKYNAVSGLLTYKIDDMQTIAFAAGGNMTDTSRSSFETPLLQNNSSIYNIIYTYLDGPWTVMPYLQYTHVDKEPAIGITDGAATIGAALLTTYQFDEAFSLSGRAEYIDSSGDGASNLLYGTGSSAWSMTLTPTYRLDNYFMRGEASYVEAHDSIDGFAFGKNGDKDSQARFLVEIGAIF